MSLLVISALISLKLLILLTMLSLDIVRFNSANKYVALCTAICCTEIIDGASNFDPEKNK